MFTIITAESQTENTAGIFPWLRWIDISIFYHSCSQSSQWIYLCLIITEYYKALTLKETASVGTLAPIICSEGEQLFISLRCCPICPPLQLLIIWADRQPEFPTENVTVDFSHPSDFFFLFLKIYVGSCSWSVSENDASAVRQNPNFSGFCHLASHPCWSLPSGY